MLGCNNTTLGCWDNTRKSHNLNLKPWHPAWVSYLHLVFVTLQLSVDSNGKLYIMCTTPPSIFSVVVQIFNCTFFKMCIGWHNLCIAGVRWQFSFPPLQARCPGAQIETCALWTCCYQLSCKPRVWREAFKAVLLQAERTWYCSRSSVSQGHWIARISCL